MSTSIPSPSQEQLQAIWAKAMHDDDYPTFAENFLWIQTKEDGLQRLKLWKHQQQLNFFRSGLRITFESGKIVGVENLGTDMLKDCGAEFPGLSFLQILFGRRSLGEVRNYVADCSEKNDEVRVLLETLFPRKPSNVWGIS